MKNLTLVIFVCACLAIFATVLAESEDSNGDSSSMEAVSDSDAYRRHYRAKSSYSSRSRRPYSRRSSSRHSHRRGRVPRKLKSARSVRHYVKRQVKKSLTHERPAPSKKAVQRMVRKIVRKRAPGFSVKTPRNLRKYIKKTLRKDKNSMKGRRRYRRNKRSKKLHGDRSIRHYVKRRVNTGIKGKSSLRRKKNMKRYLKKQISKKMRKYQRKKLRSPRKMRRYLKKRLRRNIKKAYNKRGRAGRAARRRARKYAKRQLKKSAKRFKRRGRKQRRKRHSYQRKVYRKEKRMARRLKHSMVRRMRRLAKKSNMGKVKRTLTKRLRKINRNLKKNKKLHRRLSTLKRRFRRGRSWRRRQARRRRLAKIHRNRHKDVRMHRNLRAEHRLLRRRANRMRHKLAFSISKRGAVDRFLHHFEREFKRRLRKRFGRKGDLIPVQLAGIRRGLAKTIEKHGSVHHFLRKKLYYLRHPSSSILRHFGRKRRKVRRFVRQMARELVHSLASKFGKYSRVRRYIHNRLQALRRYLRRKYNSDDATYRKEIKKHEHAFMRAEAKKDGDVMPPSDDDDDAEDKKEKEDEFERRQAFLKESHGNLRAYLEKQYGKNNPMVHETVALQRKADLMHGDSSSDDGSSSGDDDPEQSFVKMTKKGLKKRIHSDFGSHKAIREFIYEKSKRLKRRLRERLNRHHDFLKYLVEEGKKLRYNLHGKIGAGHEALQLVDERNKANMAEMKKRYGREETIRRFLKEEGHIMKKQLYHKFGVRTTTYHYIKYRIKRWRLMIAHKFNLRSLEAPPEVTTDLNSKIHTDDGLHWEFRENEDVKKAISMVLKLGVFNRVKKDLQKKYKHEEDVRELMRAHKDHHDLIEQGLETAFGKGEVTMRLRTMIMDKLREPKWVTEHLLQPHAHLDIVGQALLPPTAQMLRRSGFIQRTKRKLSALLIDMPTFEHWIGSTTMRPIVKRIEEKFGKKDLDLGLQKGVLNALAREDPLRYRCEKLASMISMERETEQEMRMREEMTKYTDELKKELAEKTLEQAKLTLHKKLTQKAEEEAARSKMYTQEAAEEKKIEAEKRAIAKEKKEIEKARRYPKLARLKLEQEKIKADAEAHMETHKGEKSEVSRESAEIGAKSKAKAAKIAKEQADEKKREAEAKAQQKKIQDGEKKFEKEKSKEEATEQDMEHKLVEQRAQLQKKLDTLMETKKKHLHHLKALRRKMIRRLHKRKRLLRKMEDLKEKKKEHTKEEEAEALAERMREEREAYMRHRVWEQHAAAKRAKTTYDSWVHEGAAHAGIPAHKISERQRFLNLVDKVFATAEKRIRDITKKIDATRKMHDPNLRPIIKVLFRLRMRILTKMKADQIGLHSHALSLKLAQHKFAHDIQELEEKLRQLKAMAASEPSAKEMHKFNILLSNTANNWKRHTRMLQHITHILNVVNSEL